MSLTREYKEYIQANLIENFKGLKLKRDFAAKLNSLEDFSNIFGGVKYMAAANAPDFTSNYLTDLAQALEMSKEALVYNNETPTNDLSVQKREKDSLSNLMSLEDIKEWFRIIESARNAFDPNLAKFPKEWTQDLLHLPKRVLDHFANENTVKLPLRSSLSAMGLTDVFMRVFWPFRFDISEMNQRLGVYGLSNRNVKKDIKSSFFESLETVQGVSIPYLNEEIVYSFDHPELVDGMNRSKLVVFSEDFVQGKKHIFSESNRNDIVSKTKEALKLIKKTSPELYRSILQLVACFAFYKSENPSYQGGSTSSALGVIWMDPSAGPEWTVPFYAEMIVHEFIHTHLFYAELVHGTYSNNKRLSDVKVVSAIRGKSRDYDKSFHAAYVSAGLAVFNSRAGYLNRAEMLSNTIIESVDALVKANRETSILDESGTAMLQFLDDFMTISRIQKA